MFEHSLSDLNRKPGELVDPALVAPVELTKRGRRHLVMKSAADHDALVAGGQKVKEVAPYRSNPR